jgi:hypothetical protein
MKNDKLFGSLFSLIFLLVFSFNVVFAQTTEYVLPYPSAMPGGYLYKINILNEFIQRYLSFGSFSQFRYNLRYADKYLVEAKTLFEYKQYFLGMQALKTSNKYFVAVRASLNNAGQEGKDTSLKKKTLESASLKHIEVLRLLNKDLPAEFVWADENKTPVTLLLHSAIKEGINLRSAK